MKAEGNHTSQILKIIPRRMPFGSLPVHATNGELIITTDTTQIYVGKGAAKPSTAASAGSGWHYAAGAPSTLYTNGDFYLNATTGEIYQQVSGAWGAAI